MIDRKQWLPDTLFTPTIGLTLVLIILVGCTFQPAPAVSPTLGFTSTIELANPQPSLTLTPSAPAIQVTFSPAESLPPSQKETPQPSETSTPVSYPLTEYRLKAILDFTMRHVSVNEEITYVHASPDSLQELLLIVEPNRYPGCFKLDEVRRGEERTASEYQLQGNRLSIKLPQSVKQGETVHLSLKYQLFLPEIPAPEQGSRPQPFGVTGRQANLVDWYPYLPPYRAGEGWQMHDPWFFGEHQVYETANFEVEISLAGSGLVGDQPIVLAASAPAISEGNTHFYRLEKARSFAWSASPNYQTLSTKVENITIQSYFFPFHEEGGRAALQHTADAVRLFQKLFGAYPHDSLSIIEADFLDGMEYDGLFFLSRGFYNLYEGTPAGYLTAIAVHETAHQWWYGLVGNDQALEPWLDEALCTYSEKLFYENVYPELVEWWWSFRVNYYRPTGPVNGAIFDFAGFWPYRDAVYLRGALFLEELRLEMGDEAFFTFLRDYASQMSHRQATAGDFFGILSQHFPADLTGLLSLYFQEKH